MIFNKEESEISQKLLEFQTKLNNIMGTATVKDVHDAFNELTSSVVSNGNSIMNPLLKVNLVLAISGYVSFCEATRTTPNINKLLIEIIEGRANKNAERAIEGRY